MKSLQLTTDVMLKRIRNGKAWFSIALSWLRTSSDIPLFLSIVLVQLFSKRWKIKKKHIPMLRNWGWFHGESNTYINYVSKLICFLFESPQNFGLSVILHLSHCRGCLWLSMILQRTKPVQTNSSFIKSKNKIIKLSTVLHKEWMLIFFPYFFNYLLSYYLYHNCIALSNTFESILTYRMICTSLSAIIH